MRYSFDKYIEYSEEDLRNLTVRNVDSVKLSKFIRLQKLRLILLSILFIIIEICLINYLSIYVSIFFIIFFLLIVVIPYVENKKIYSRYVFRIVELIFIEKMDLDYGTEGYTNDDYDNMQGLPVKVRDIATGNEKVIRICHDDYRRYYENMPFNLILKSPKKL